MLENPFDLSGRVAIVTGGGTGIGEAIAHVLARYGADVVVASRKLEKLEAVAREVSAATGRRCLPVTTDVRDEEQVKAMVERTVAELGRIDILVNNAGGGYLFPLEQTPLDRWDNNIALNLTGPFLCTRAVGPHMISGGGGAIVNISSDAGRSGVRGGSAYSAGKAGLQMFTRVVAAEWGPHGIRANCICVGAIASEGALRSWDRAGLKREEMARQMPLRRIGEPEDIAWPVLFLASDASRYMSGETFGVDGGPAGMGGLPEPD